MSDPISSDVTPDPVSPEDTTDPVESGDSLEEQFDADKAKAEIRKKNSEAANLRKRLKELEPLAAKAKELEDSNKTETEKLSERVSAAEKNSTAAQSELMRLRVAMRKGLTESQAKRLVGSNEDELESDADELLTSFGGGKSPTKEDPKPKVAGRPKTQMRGGGDPDEPAEENDPLKIVAAIPRR